MMHTEANVRDSNIQTFKKITYVLAPPEDLGGLLGGRQLHTLAATPVEVESRVKIRKFQKTDSKFPNRRKQGVQKFEFQVVLSSGFYR